MSKENYTWTIEQLKEAVAISFSYIEVCKYLHISVAYGSRIGLRIKRLGLDISHFRSSKARDKRLNEKVFVYKGNPEAYHLEKAKEHYAFHKEEYSIRSKLQRAQNRQLLWKAKAKGCAVCLEKEFCCMDFHHIYGKERMISTMLGSNSKRVQKEIDKCLVLCANCHRKHHHNLIDIAPFYTEYHRQNLALLPK